MDGFDATISGIVDRRQMDIAMTKRAILLGKSDRQRNMLVRSCVLIIYASLEGGIKEMCRHYLSTINLAPPMAQDLVASYLYFAAKQSCKIGQAVSDHEKGEMLSVSIRDFMGAPIVMPTAVETESNLTPKVLSRIARVLNLDFALDNRGEADLNQLLRFRNNISHGDQRMPIDDSRISQFSGITQYILTEFASAICRAHHKKGWLAPLSNTQ